MFEAHVLHLLRRYLGEYVHGLSAETLRISVWKGDVVLKDLKLKAEALNSLKLPITVKAGFVGTITLKVPWKSLGKEPVIVLIDRVFVLAHPVVVGRSLKEEDREKLFEAKLQQIEEAELATLEALSRSKLGGNPAVGNSWLGSLIATIIGNLKISISNVHVRYEDSVSHPGYPFCCGITLAKLAAVTMDEQGNETFDTSGALDKLRKLVQLERLAVYHDTNTEPWKLDKKWEDLTPAEWIEIFENGINESTNINTVVSAWTREHNYLVYPINGVLKYHRLGNQERSDPSVPYEQASLIISDVSLTATEMQYHDWIRLMEAISNYKTYVEVSHLRPLITVSERPSLWWRYAAHAGLQQKKICYRFSWDQIQHLCNLRRCYVQLYAESLQKLSNVDKSKIRSIEKDLDPKVILLWRFLAHAKVESVKSKEAAEQRMLKNRSWFSFAWRAAPEDCSAGESSEDSKSVEDTLTKEEWQAINKLLSYQPDEDLALQHGKETHNMTHYLINVSICRAAAAIINVDQTEILCGRFENLNLLTKLKQRTIQCDVSLKFYGLSAPEGSLAQSVCSEQKVNALEASFVHSPSGENVDWKLSARISPSHVTVFMESYYRFLDFVNRSNAISPILAVETATVIQNKFEKMTRRAQEQFQMALEEQSRFALDIDLDAPKVRVPLISHLSCKCDSHLLLDFGHFTLQTKEDGHSHEQGQSLYSRFYISGRDIAAFFTDCGSDNQTCSLASQPSNSPTLEDINNIYSLIDRCRMAVIVDQIKNPHSSHSSTRISVQLPSIGVHFSPARLHRLLELFDILHRTIPDTEQHPLFESTQAELFPWHPPDLATDARILVWKGIGYSIAAWQPCYLVLSGLYLYVLESEGSHTYQRCSSVAGRQVFEVPQTNVGGSPSCIAVSVRGMDLQKALESFSTLIIEFRDEEEKTTWLRTLVRATYRASAPPSVNVLRELSDGALELAETHSINEDMAELVVNGSLVEMKLSLYGKSGDEIDNTYDETLILEVLAVGGKVHVSQCSGDLTVKMKLHSLKIKDELQYSLSSGPQYLACSVLPDQSAATSPGTTNSHGKELAFMTREEEDVFKDALQDFLSLPDYGEAITPEKDSIKGRSDFAEVFYETQSSDYSDFVSLSYISRQPSSPDYNGIDTQMSISMSKLEFFCNRPTLVALIDFAIDVSSESSGVADENIIKDPVDESAINKEKLEEHVHKYVKGLLGYGKSRVVFNLNMNVDSVTVFLNKEDGSQLALLVQECFMLDIKVHPSSTSIEGTLGNFRLCDLTLGSNQQWGWLCDIRNQGTESLIQFAFSSHNSEDDDYEGYEYSLCGRLSAVRIVFLYRFVQEITAYFMGLATPHTEEAIKFVDKVGGLEWFIEKYEIDGATAIKLDLSLDTPLIIVPGSSTSEEFMQLDLGHLRIKNEVSWIGSPEKDPSAVHIDVLDAEVVGINMAVGINGCIGRPMIREGRDIHIYVRRSLRDVFRKVPTFVLEVKIGLLHGVMSDKEYNVILDSLYVNFSEEPKLPPPFRSNKSASKDTIRLLADRVNMNSQILLSRTVTIMSVEVGYALLDLCNGVHEESHLAHIALEGLWVSYRMTSLSEADLYVTIPKFSILDSRPDTKPEMRLMLGSCSDAHKQMSPDVNIDLPTSTMFLMDCRWRTSSMSFVVRIQQPRVLVVPDFLLAVCEYFVPSLGTITGREEVMDPKNDPIVKNSSIVFSAPFHKQAEDIVHLSPSRQLVADAVGIDEYVYDGCGKTICLTVEEGKEMHSSEAKYIIIIGRGKRLRFVNVKIENGLLLRKYTYLSNDSSYFVSQDDGVEILFVESTIDTGKRSPENIEELFYTSDAVQSGASQAQSYSFEAQVVSPEFTFYDSSKSSLDNSSYGEKLLRAKVDVSFMYAAKENDRWIRGLLKDLTVEAGSGLIILDPVDISGGYTSVKDKTNISLFSTDIYAHLSLGVISLLLNLQIQLATTLQFGNADPLSPCTHFHRIWVSPKENGILNHVTFWRPRAPPNYVILGDCVTSRPNPPSQAVVAISNTYGRVRKPLGYELIGKLSGTQGSTGVDDECSLWLPIAPAGYMAVGCVAHIGSQQPPNHIVHCIRCDLITSTTYSECLFSAAVSSSFISGYSIWRLDNALGSFYAHQSTEHPPKESCFDLNHLLLWSSSWYRSSSIYPSIDLTYEHECMQPHTSGWDIVRSISKATSCYVSTPNFERIWWDRGSDLRRPVSIWRPITRPGYAVLGDCITEGLEPPPLGMIFKADNPEISANPVQFTKVAHILVKGLDEAFFWYPIAPPGYATLGCVVTRHDEAPPLESFCCPRMDLVSGSNIVEIPISRSSSSKASQCWSIWKVENQACTFLARPDMKKPSTRLAFAIGDSVKPKTRENVTSEMKLRCFSITFLDSFCGMMTPLFDVTITNLKLATHGRIEAMNAVLISSIAASTFNTRLEAWDPFVEPFDGIYKFETYETNIQSSSSLGKRLRIAATSILNINISASNLGTLAQTVNSWRKQRELEQKAIKLLEEARGRQDADHQSSTLSALDEDDFQTVVVENKLGCDMYLKKVEENSDAVELLPADSFASVWIPPPRFSDRLNVIEESRDHRRYVTVQIVEAKSLPVVDDGNSHNLFCALRLVVESQDTSQQKVFPQSARTKCVKPLIAKLNGQDEGTAKWNELFIFEVPRKGLAKLEVEVTNLASKAGKGEVVGAASFSVGHGSSVLKKIASVRMLHSTSNAEKILCHPLKRKGQLNNESDSPGCLFISTSYFEKKTTANFQNDLGEKDGIESDVGFWVGLNKHGPWESIRSFLPMSVITKTVNSDYLAVEVVTKNGKKHAIFRGLATVCNDSDITLEYSSCDMSVIHSQEHRTHQVQERGTSGLISPGCSSVLPWKCTFKDSNNCLQVRPCIDHSQTAYAWGQPVFLGSGYVLGKDLLSIEQSTLSRQNTLRQGSGLPVSPLKLNQLEKTDLLFCCPGATGKRAWLCVGTDASVLNTELNAPVYDWKISISSPLKLENRLPCEAELRIFEKIKDGSIIERHHGYLASRETMHIYSADIRNPLYLMMFVQGGWALEKDPIMFLDLINNSHASSFWMVHQQRKRTLRVSIERDLGGTTAAPKTIRFFVPYWITNESYLCLAYRVVEIEPGESASVDSLVLSRAAKSAKLALRSPSTVGRKQIGPRKIIQVLDIIEDTSPTPSMLSPQDYVGRGGVVLFSSRNDSYPSSRVGISVAIQNSENFSPGISLLELEKKQRVDIKAFGPNGNYYKLSAVLHMTSDRTKVVHFQPHTLFLNRLGCDICLCQCNSELLEWIHPTDPPKHLAWQHDKVELLKIRLDGYKWSAPFSVGAEGLMCICLRSETGSSLMHVRVEVRSGSKESHYEVVFRPKAFSSPYRIENHSLLLPVHVRQVDGTNDSWRVVFPNASISFSWEDLGRERLIELLIEGNDPASSRKYNIDEISDHQPAHAARRPEKALRVTVLKEEKMNVVRISDWMPVNDTLTNLNRSPSSSHISGSSHSQQSVYTSDSEFHAIVEVAELGLSIIDHTPEEILYLSVQSLVLSYSTGLGSGVSRLKARMRGIQVDNQLPLSPMPVLFRPQRIEEHADYILKFSLTQQSTGSLDLCVYPYIGFQGPENSAFLINIHEPIIWRLHGMIQQASLSGLFDTQSTSVSVDPIVQIGAFNISEIRIKVSMVMSPSQRPVGVLGFWSSLMTALGNTENMPVRINQRFLENVSMKRSILVGNAIANVKKDLLSQPLQLLSGVDILGNASSALGHMSKGVAALSMDKKFIQSRQKQESKGVEDFGDVIREGGGAFAKGLFRGVTGILTKPLEGAKASGVEGFVQGVGKGLIGAAAQPVSGVLDLLSKTTEGANAMRMKIASAIASEDQLLRRRLPRVISADNLLRPYDEYKAQGQVILQLAESGSFFGQVDLFKVRAKFALTDAYEDHFMLPKGRIIVITHQRVLLLQQPSNLIAQKKFNPARDPCSVLWDVLWDDLVTMELSPGKKDAMNGPPSRLIIYLQSRSLEGKDQVRIIKCQPNSNQTFEVYSSIELARTTYGPRDSKVMLKRKVTKPYSPGADSASTEVISNKEGGGAWSPQPMPTSTFGSSEQ
ncbi:hypothetical protein DM860_013410 [Cuscuta australis]|uniref:C2 domain-containing protein n=1 Tax=Cuscuta australis TaxID=267555 RepID=A0A328DP48_9ASTE|nr:hypothetical protein DM860_013410 [Cuscuta australis]